MRVAVLAIVLAWTSLARAQPAEPALAPPGLTQLTRPLTPPVPYLLRPGAYHGQMLALDAVTAGLLASAAVVDDKEFRERTLLAGVATYALGGTIVHLAQEHKGRAFVSLALRVSLPAVGFWIGDLDKRGGKEAIGTVIGMLTAIGIDDFYLARGERPKAEPAWTPTASATRGGVSLGVGASF